MAQHKKDSKALHAGKVRLAGLKAIDPKLQFSSHLSIKIFEAGVVDLDKKLAAHNQLLAEVDASLAEVQAKEQVVSDLSKRMLAGAAARFGEDSPEYTQAGGTRTSERKRYGQLKKQQAARKRPHQRGEVVVMPSQLATAVSSTSTQNGASTQSGPSMQNGVSTQNGVAKTPVVPVVTQ